MTTDPEIEQSIRAVLLRDLNLEARFFVKLKGGRNSQVFRVDCSDGRAVAVKAYFRSTQDRRDRMGCEFRALQYLRSEGLEKIAAPLAADEARGIAVYEFISGDRVQAEDVASGDIDQAVNFLGELKTIAGRQNAVHFPPASEACFSLEAIFDNVDSRLRRLEQSADSEPALADFLRNEFTTSLETVKPWCRDFCRATGIDPAAELPLRARTFSPSDFGFHNTLRRPDGQLIFLDFEYFGWDDPAKTIADFLLHPGMRLARSLKQRFFTGTIPKFSDVPNLANRVQAVYPLFALKWCTILLNEFTLDHRARRQFAVGASGVWSQTEQLEKARRLLAEAMDEYRNFPYHC